MGLAGPSMRHHVPRLPDHHSTEQLIADSYTAYLICYVRRYTCTVSMITEYCILKTVYCIYK
jgi:hypothetical protein